MYCFQSSFLSVLILVQTVISRTPHSRRSKESVKRDKHWWLQDRGSCVGGGGVYCFQSSFLSVLILVQTVISRTPHSRPSKESVKRDKHWWLQNRGCWGGGGNVLFSVKLSVCPDLGSNRYQQNTSQQT